MAPQITLNHLFLLAGTAAASISLQYAHTPSLAPMPSRKYELVIPNMEQLSHRELFGVGGTNSSVSYVAEGMSLPQYAARQKAKVKILPPRALSLPSFGEGEG